MIRQGILLLFLSLGIFSCNQEQQKTPPNIILILADDLGAGDLHCTGHPYARTPHLDGLAEQGTRFDRAYMAGAWCAPSRYGLMSGKFPARYFDQTRTIRSDEPTVTGMLQHAGYQIAHFGKWHLTNDREGDVSPGDLGIDEHFLTSFRGAAEVNTWSREARNQEYWRAQTTDAYVDMTIDFIRKNRGEKEKKPFYVNLWIYPTHSYIHPTPEQLAVYTGLEVNSGDFNPYQQEFLKFVAEHGDIDKAMQAYCADVTAMDRALGRLFDFIESEGLGENTLIVFTSDNGPGPLATQVKSGSVVERYKERPDLLNSVGSAKIYKERKISLHDGGIRVPFIVAWEGNIPGGKVNATSVIHGTDWLPTIASICGLEMPEGTFDGVDVSPAFLGGEPVREKEVYWTQAGAVAMLQGRWKAILERNGELLLYDIVNDPGERNELSAEYPEQAASLRNSIIDWKNSMNATSPN